MAVLLTSSRGSKSGSVGLTVLAVAASLAVLYFARIFFVTVTIAVILALMLESFVTMLMRLRMPRPAAAFVACSVAVFFVYLAGLGLWVQLVALTDEFPRYSARITQLFESVQENAANFEEKLFRLVVPKRDQERIAEEAPPPEPAPRRARQRAAPAPAPPMPPPPEVVQEVRIRPDRPVWLDFLYSRLGDFYQFLLFASFVPFLVYFFLSWRDHFHRSIMGLFEGPERIIADRTWEGIAEMARAFVVGNFVLGLILSLVASLTFLIFGLPYPLLLGVVSGFLSLVPYLGVPLAILPALLGAITVYDTIPPYVLLGSLIAMYHLTALNLLYPKVVGSRVHLNPLAVTLAIMFWTVLWGEVGLVLAIPITAGIKAVCDNIAHLQPYGRLLGD